MSSVNCVPLFSWDPALASAAQAWADQCALVEYTGNQKGEALLISKKETLCILQNFFLAQVD